MKRFKSFISFSLLAVCICLFAFAAMAEEPVKLETPTDVRWVNSYDENPVGLYAMFGELDERAEGVYQIDVYKDEKKVIGIISDAGPLTRPGFAMWPRITESGSYKFRVRAIGSEFSGTSNSEWSEWSEAFEYTKPEVSFGDVQNLQWSDSEVGMVSWDIPSNLKNVPEADRNSLRYFVRLYDGDGNNIFGIYNVTDSSYDFSSWMNEGMEYVFSVQAQSRHLERVASGKEIKSQPFTSMGEIVDGVKNDLDDLLLNYGSDEDEELASPSDALKAVESLDIREMAVAVQTDEHVLDTLSEIEAIYLERSGKSVELEVSDDMGLTLDDVDVYGAGLNIASASNAIKVEVKTPDKDAEVDSLIYKNVVQMDISLKDAEKPLHAPITVIMKIPETINPDYLRVLHYHGNNPEIIWPAITDNGRAKFTVIEFSRFVFVERNILELGDDDDPEPDTPESPGDLEDPGNIDLSGSHSGSSGGSGGSSGGSSSSGTITIDDRKGRISSVSGIITGTGDGYSEWISDTATSSEIKWKLKYADGTYAAGSYVTDDQGNQIKDSNGNPVEQPLWELINGYWYVFGADGYMKTGLVFDPSFNGWFYLDVNVGMKTGWQKINGIWYYFNTVADGSKGIMFINRKTPDGYYVTTDGSWDGEPNA